MIHTVKGFSIIEETEMFFSEIPCFLYDSANVDILISSSSLFPKHSLDIWKFLVCITLKLNMQDFKHGFTNIRDECNYLMVSIFFGTALGSWDKD